ncbi:MAG TPA: TspO/MBR family protein [Leptolyngbyaceae cyanobacterium]
MIPSWMIIGGVTLLVAIGGFLFKPRDLKWAAQLERPNWLTFEPLIPVIWTTIFTCGAVSAYIVWEKEPGSLKTWLLMGLYLTLELITVSYTTVTLRTRSLTVGTIIGATGAVLSVVLTLTVWQISDWAAVLLLPYVIWSPIGSYTTWEMIRLNPSAE